MIKIPAIVALFLFIPVALANVATVRKSVEARFPGVKIQSVAKAPIKGLYEVVLQGRLLYVDKDASHLFVGSIIDTKTQRNLTEERMRRLFRVKFDTLPLNRAIKVVKGNGRRRMAVFSDPECPFCVKLEKELQGVGDVTVYTFLFPLDSLHPGASAKARAIWCAPDRARAWDAWMRERRLPRTGGTCTTPLAQIAQLGRKLGVNGTPTIIFADGKVVPGAVPVQKLERLLNAAAGK